MLPIPDLIAPLIIIGAKPPKNVKPILYDMATPVNLILAGKRQVINNGTIIAATPSRIPSIITPLISDKLRISQ